MNPFFYAFVTIKYDNICRHCCVDSFIPVTIYIFTYMNGAVAGSCRQSVMADNGGNKNKAPRVLARVYNSLININGSVGKKKTH